MRMLRKRLNFSDTIRFAIFCNVTTRFGVCHLSLLLPPDLLLPLPLPLAVSFPFSLPSSSLDCVNLHRHRIVQIPHVRGVQITLDHSFLHHLLFSNRLCVKV